MKKLVACLMAVALFAVLCNFTYAEEAAATVITGKVAVEADAAGAVTKITVTVGEGDKAVVYGVALDDNGKKLAACKDKACKVTGAVAEKDGAKTITVATCEEVKAEAK